MASSSSLNLLIVPAKASDVQSLRQISIATFREAFAEQNAAEHMNEYIATALSESKLASELNTGQSQFMLAYMGQDLIGYLKVNFGDAQTEHVDGDTMEIERIYVYASVYGTGVGQALLNRAIEMAKAAGVTTIWLGVWEHNLKAVRFYQRNGFEKFGEHIFHLGSDAQVDILMRRRV
ncbi:MAG: GNAT family N-acetyltransferase [Taibaiella sp.]|nr:GNAT family N-acetyltransferase [Taibaiella sp.]